MSPHQGSGEFLDYFCSLTCGSGVLLASIYIEIADVAIGAVCPDPNLKTTLSRLFGEILLQGGRPLNFTIASSMLHSR